MNQMIVLLTFVLFFAHTASAQTDRCTGDCATEEYAQGAGIAYAGIVHNVDGTTSVIDPTISIEGRVSSLLPNDQDLAQHICKKLFWFSTLIDLRTGGTNRRGSNSVVLTCK